MATPGRATQAKRARERSNQEKQNDKRVERAKRKEDREIKKAARGPDDEDPDLAGIVAGPQPIPEDY